MTDTAIAAYLSGLVYDPRVLLSATEDGATEAIPLHTRSTENNSVIVCTNVRKSISKDISDFAILSPTAGVIFPGALLLANRRLVEGKPDPFALPRAPATLRIDLPGLGDQGRITVERPTNSRVQAAIDSVLEKWNATAAAQGYVNKARSLLNVTKAYSSQQLALDLGFSAKWKSGDVAAKLTANSNSNSSVAVAYFKQVYYTVEFDTPETPTSVFGSEVTLEQIQKVADNDNPPAYVRSVDYGRIVMVKMETSSSENKASLTAALSKVATSGTKLSGNLDSRTEHILLNSTFTVVVLGGNAKSAASITQLEDISKLPEVIHSGSAYSRENPGAPISYTVAFLQDNQIATLGLSTNYNERECMQFQNGMVQVEHAGGYIAKFSIAWDEHTSNGQLVSRLWESGNKTAGFAYQQDLPGDAKNIRIDAWAATGLVWDPWGQIFSVKESGPSNMRYVAQGTTLMRKWSKVKPEDRQ